MKKVLVLLALFVLSIFARLTSAQTLSLGPEVMTFLEIAQKLSMSGRTVKCSTELKQRAAFVSLKKHTWEENVALLSQGLQIQFVLQEGTDHIYIIRRDSHVQSREQQWLRKFSENIGAYIQARIKVMAPYTSLTPNAAKQKMEEIGAEIEQISMKLYDLEQQGVMSGDIVNQLHKKIAKIGSVARFLEDPTSKIDFQWLSNNIAVPVEIEETIKKGQIFRIRNLNQESESALEPVISYLKVKNPRASLENYDQLIGGLRFISTGEGIGFIPNLAVIASNQPVIALHPEAVIGLAPPVNALVGESLIDAVFEGVDSDSEAKFEGLGKEAAQWLTKERSQTGLYLQQEKANQIIKVESSGDPLYDLSQFIEIWSVKTDMEAIMELYPQQENISITGSRSLKLSEVYNPKTSLWSFLESNHVLMVTNRLAFLDRWRNLPIASLIRYERKIGKHTLGENIPFNYEALRAYYKDVASGTFSLWTFPTGIKAYRGMNTNRLDRSLGAVCLWEGLSRSERIRLYNESMKLKRNQGYGGSSVPLERCSARDKAMLLTHLQNWGFNNIQSFHSRYSEVIANGKLNIEMEPSLDTSLPFLIHLSVLPPEDSDTLIWGAEASFLWKPNGNNAKN